MNKELSSKFPSVLRDALEKGIVSFPKDVLEHYDSFKAFRAIRRPKDVPVFPLKIEDFYSQMEKYKNNLGVRNVDETNIGAYSCSFFLSKEALKEALDVLPKKIHIIYGSIEQINGLIHKNSETLHIDFWIYYGLQIDKLDFMEVDKYESE